jgi:hypothetical protein
MEQNHVRPKSRNENFAEGRPLGVIAVKKQADAFARGDAGIIIAQLLALRMSARRIARELTARGIKTA